MRSRAIAITGISFLLLFVVAACDDQPSPASPSASVVASAVGCDLSAAYDAVTDYIRPGGNPNLRRQAQNQIDALEAACAANDAGLYTSTWYQLAATIEAALEAGKTNAPGLGNSALQQTMTVLLPAGGSALRPCGASPVDCLPWPGHPAVPDFTAALSTKGTFAVVPDGTAPICSGHRSPCPSINPASDGDVWGMEPSDTYQSALFGRKTLAYGAPLNEPSPTGEALLAASPSAYEFNLIPSPTTFNVAAGAVLEVGLCPVNPASSGETVIQKADDDGGIFLTSVLEEAFLSFCPIQTAVAPAPGGFFARLVDFFDPRPRQLNAVAFRWGPGGGTGGYSKFWALDDQSDGTFRISDPPVDGVTGQTLSSATGPVTLQSFTAGGTPTEKTLFTIRFFKQNGFVASGNDVIVDPSYPNTNLTCSNGVCTGTAQADQETDPGEMAVPVIFNAPGAYRMCVTASRSPYTYITADGGSEACTDGHFNIRPN